MHADAAVFADEEYAVGFCGSGCGGLTTSCNGLPLEKRLSILRSCSRVSS
jgi:hypothetical protein